MRVVVIGSETKVGSDESGKEEQESVVQTRQTKRGDYEMNQETFGTSRALSCRVHLGGRDSGAIIESRSVY